MPGNQRGTFGNVTLYAPRRVLANLALVTWTSLGSCRPALGTNAAPPSRPAPAPGASVTRASGARVRHVGARRASVTPAPGDSVVYRARSGRCVATTGVCVAINAKNAGHARGASVTALGNVRSDRD